MSATRAALRGIRRAVSLAGRLLPALRSSDPAPHATPLDETPADAMLRQVEALQLEAFRRTFARYYRRELAEIGADVASIPGAIEAVAAQFTEWEAARATRVQLAAEATAQHAAAAVAVAKLAAHLLCLVPLILHRTSMRVLRPLSPRAPALARLT